MGGFFLPRTRRPVPESPDPESNDLMTSTKNPPHHVGVIGGDGIGPEVT
ncbi:MAG TPA: 3-isopropylmalate dehydrogenase, partial [Candidatus Microthrix parvicella]|nr:3-isopropylmalate dehydrogenase [Candidatus Microthrix parvicella]